MNDKLKLEAAIKEFARHDEEEFKLLTKWLVELKNRRVVEERRNKRLEKSGELERESLQELRDSLQRMGIVFAAKQQTQEFYHEDV